VEESGLISGGFFVLNPKALDLIEDDATLWEKTPMETLATRGELQAYRHAGFWQPMDTLRDRMGLDAMAQAGTAPWMSWSTGTATT
jgi:glucose-1-phosphate cytidylyltransferase